VPDTRTRLNHGEGEVIALTIMDMIALRAPTTSPLHHRRICGKDIWAIANYIGQILETCDLVTFYAEHVYLDQETLDTILYKMISNLRGVRRNIFFYSTTIASGTLRLPMDTSLLLGFVADIGSLNMSLTRCRIARYIVGAH